VLRYNDAFTVANIAFTVPMYVDECRNGYPGSLDSNDATEHELDYVDHYVVEVLDCGWDATDGDDDCGPCGEIDDELVEVHCSQGWITIQQSTPLPDVEVDLVCFIATGDPGEGQFYAEGEGWDGSAVIRPRITVVDDEELWKKRYDADTATWENHEWTTSDTAHYVGWTGTSSDGVAYTNRYNVFEFDPNAYSGCESDDMPDTPTGNADYSSGGGWIRLPNPVQ
jgi:hypothetical protein